jgi:hypothetical protein
MAQARKWLVVLSVCLCGLSLPALAQARAHSLRWQRVAEPTPWHQADETQFAPNVELAVADGVPYVSSIDKEGSLTIWRPNRRETSWRQLGGPLNHVPAERVDDVSMATSGRTVWVAWSEETERFVRQPHLAKLVGESFREVASDSSPVSPDEPAGSVSVAIYGGRPYMAYNVNHGDVVPVEVVRLSRNERAWEHVDPNTAPPLPQHESNPQLAVSGGRLWLVHELFVPGLGNEIHVLRLDDRRHSWQTILTQPGNNFHEPVDFRGSLYALWSASGSTNTIYRITGRGATVAYPDAGFLLAFGPGGVPYTAFGVGSGEYDAPREVALAAFLGGEWRNVDSPIDPGDDVGTSIMHLLSADGTLWMIWESGHGSVFAPPREAHVARLVRR